MRCCFEIPGKPKGKARPKFNGRRNVTYTPKETREYENFVRYCYNRQCGKQKLDGEIIAEVTAYFPVPKSATKAEREKMLTGKKRPTVKPDIDNITKTILDALNKYAYKDDSAVVKIISEKKYSAEPKVTVILTDGGTQ